MNRPLHPENGALEATSPATAPNRRQALSWLVGLSSGALALPGCGGGSDAPSWPGFRTADTLPEAPVLRAENGVLSLTLRVTYTRQALQISRTPAGATPSYPSASTTQSTWLRSFNGQFMAPTLELQAGELLRLRLVNALPANTRQSSLDHLNHQNSTNLHFHGLHVDPREIRPGVFGDYVVDTAEAGVQPGQERQHELRIPASHTAGVHWYHPHLHGSTNVQVASGMFGAILVRHPNDRFAPPSEVRERTMFVHKTFADAQGEIASFYDTVRNPATDFMLNGALQPTLVMQPGEVQKWHFINAASFFPFSPALDGHTLWAFARDGNVDNGRFRALNDDTAGRPDNGHWPGNDIFPGGRHSVLVQASMQPGEYLLRNRKPQAGRDEIVARIVVEGSAVAASLPPASALPRYASYAPITDEELASRGGRQRHLVLAALAVGDARLAPLPDGEGWTVPPQDGMPSLETNVFATGDFNGGQMQLAPYQSALTPTQTLALGSVEEWTVHNPNGYAHPFHIHINDAYVVRINDEPVTPFWADTLPIPTGNGSLTFRMRLDDFAGKFVWHCHALDHEDLGMMQLVEIVA